ncbi:MAG: LuxR C-terminal-related transcriptional regulator [Bacteroidales bacterium]
MPKRGFKRLPDYISEVSEPLYDQIHSYVQILDGVSRITNQSISLIDFFKGEILYVSNNPLFLCGLTPKEVQELGPEFNRRYVPEKDIEYLSRVTQLWFEFIVEKPLEERKYYSLRLDYHLDHKPICVSMTPVFLSKDGKPWLLICNAIISTHSETGHATIFKYNSLTEWSFSETSQKWIENERLLLRDIEEEVLRLAIQGKKENEICQLIYRSKDGLKSIKRKLFQKMEVSNITEAVSYAISRGLI